MKLYYWHCPSCWRLITLTSSFHEKILAGEVKPVHATPAGKECAGILRPYASISATPLELRAVETAEAAKEVAPDSDSTILHVHHNPKAVRDMLGLQSAPEGA
jgi:hypothetical protein